MCTSIRNSVPSVSTKGSRCKLVTVGITPVTSSWGWEAKLYPGLRRWARSVLLVPKEAVMRAWVMLGMTVFFVAVILTLRETRGDEEMLIRLGGRDLRSLPT
jgi:hypothetical protein